ncbi:MAG: YbaB/EbfC family nucleoid-associated protein [Rhodospirillaceae bacterium]
MKNLASMMKQAQQFQSKMQEMQDALADMEITGQSGGGMCKVVLNGKGDVRAVSLDPSIIDPEDAEMLEDLIVAAFTDAKVKVEETAKEEMAKITGGLQLPPGLSLPF